MEYPSIPIGTTTTSYGITLVMTEDGWRADLQHTMMRRCRNWDYHKPWTYLVTLSCQHHEVVPMPQAASLPEGWQYPQWLRDAYAKPGRPHLFGELAGEREEDAHIVLNALGRKVDAMVRELSQRFPQLRVLEHVVMPNHLHIVIKVVERLPEKEHLGILMNRFKSAVNREYKLLALGLPDSTRMDLSYQGACSQPAVLSSQSPVLCSQSAAERTQGHGSKNPKVGLVFEPGFHDRILFREGQLARMITYCKDNPRRLWQIVNNRQYFERLMSVRIAMPFLSAGGTRGLGRWHGEADGLLAPVQYSQPPAGSPKLPAGSPKLPAESTKQPAESAPLQIVTFSIMGNRNLLMEPEKMQIQCSRKASDAEIEAMKADVLDACAHGIVPVSPCISPGEKAVARAVLEAGKPLIVLFPQGIPSDMRNKAGFGPYFDACANGQLLILSPWEYGKPATARMQHAAGSVLSSQPPAASIPTRPSQSAAPSTPMRPSQPAAGGTPTRPARSTKLQRWQCLFLNDLAAQLAVGVEILGASSPNPPKAAPR